MSDQEQLDRLAATTGSHYGIGTRSYNRSPEKREVDRQRAAATAAHEAAPRKEITAPLVCACRSFPYPHPPARHGTLVHGGDWTPWEQRFFLNKQFNCWQEIRGGR